LFLPNSGITAELAIVIDDLGYHADRAERILHLPGPLTLAVLPNTPGAVQIAQRAPGFGKEVILHQPMEATPSRWALREPGTLMASMSAREFDRTFEAALDRLPNLAGVSNHTGSLLTSSPAAMQRLMAIVKKRNLYFLDSRTTIATVALAVAEANLVPATRRDIFLDNVISLEAIHSAFKDAIAKARRNGKAIVIGHPHEATIRYLEHVLYALPDDITLVSAGSLAYSSYPATAVPQQVAMSPHRAPGQ
jgi:uncharacterized protein